MPLPGGDRVVQEPWRMAVSYLAKSYGTDLSQLKIPLTAEIDQKKISEITMLIEKGINTPLISSAGRLFDAVAAITGLNYRSTYQAQSPMLLESAIDASVRGTYTYELSGQEVSFKAMISQIVNDLHQGISIKAIAAKFHQTMVELILHLAMEIREETGLDRVVLAGGTFQNRFLTTGVRAKLEKENFKVILPHTIPVNDQGICVGQLAIGAHINQRV